MTEFCTGCGQALKIGAKFCGKCGRAASTPPAPVNYGKAIAHTAPTAPPVAPIASPPVKRHGGLVVASVIAAVIALGSIGLFTLHYSQEHSPSGRTFRFQVAASKGNMGEVGSIMQEAREAKQQLDMTDALYFALMNAQPQMAQFLKDMGGDEAEARRRLKGMEITGEEPSWKKVHLKAGH